MNTVFKAEKIGDRCETTQGCKNNLTECKTARDGKERCLYKRGAACNDKPEFCQTDQICLKGQCSK